MRVLVVVLAVLLLVVICSVAGASLGDSRIAAPAQKQETIPIVCCANYISRRIPLGRIQSAFWTSESCPNPAVVLVTIKGKNICVDPKAPWVQEYLKHSELLEH